MVGEADDWDSVGAVVDEGFWACDAAGDVVALEDVDYV